jgi:phosphotransferase system enzyme I (PtsP)
MKLSGKIDDSSLLLTLEEISQLIAHSHDPAETLAGVVQMVGDRFQTQVCSVYLFDARAGELVLSATVGLKPESVGKVRMGLGEGLTGLVGQKMAPVMEPNAFSHPRFKFFPEAGEELYQSFLGVPLIESGSLVGVLVVQTDEPRTFSPNEVRMLRTVAGQVASLVGDAQLLDRINLAAHASAEVDEPGGHSPRVLRGVPLGAGRAWGSAYVVDHVERWRRALPMSGGDPAHEKQRLADAVVGAQEELKRLSQQISELVGEDHGAILQAQLMLMQDRTIEKDLIHSLEGGASAEGALLTVLDRYVAAFQSVATPHFQERVFDLKDVFHRVLWRLQPQPDFESGPGSTNDRLILVLPEASVMALFAVELSRLAGIVVEHGGPQSHAAILARTLGIPMVGQVPSCTALLKRGRLVLVDGDSGEVVLDPVLTEEKTTPVGQASRLPRASETLALRTTSADTPRIEVNINLLSEAETAVEYGAEGVGLYRSEFLFLARRTLPTEDEQVSIYRKLVRRLEGRPVCIRTFDLRPDKLASYSHLGSATARALDWRVVLESPPLQQLFHDQVRAILRVAAEAPVRMLIPLVTRTELLDFACETIALARCELAAEERPFADVPLGVMIEVPAAVPLMRLWAEHVDFFALGTNDLTASALDVDRDDPVSAPGSDPLHPGLLHLVAQAIDNARAADRPVSVCGEMAADPEGSVALACLGVNSLSVPVAQFPRIRERLSRIDPASLADLRKIILRQRTADEVRSAIVAFLQGA